MKYTNDIANWQCGQEVGKESSKLLPRNIFEKISEQTP